MRGQYRNRTLNYVFGYTASLFETTSTERCAHIAQLAFTVATEIDTSVQGVSHEATHGV